MRIAFVGDIHGRVLHLIALLELQRTGHAIDRVIQVGDFGAYRDEAYMGPEAHRFVRDDPAELDFLRLLAPDDGLALLLRHARSASRLSGRRRTWRSTPMPPRSA